MYCSHIPEEKNTSNFVQWHLIVKVNGYKELLFNDHFCVACQCVITVETDVAMLASCIL